MLSIVELILLNLNLHSLDISILKCIQGGRNPQYDSFFIFITDTAAILAFGIPAVLLIWAHCRHNHTTRQKALRILISVGVSAIVANILKYSIDLPRPFEVYPYIEKLSSGGSPSFPSGHTADAFAFAIAVSLAYPKWQILLPSLFWASLVGYSRMSLGVHFPSDVAAGALIGVICAWIAFKRRYDRIAKV